MVDAESLGMTGPGDQLAFLPDTALEVLDEDRLGHVVYVEALKDIILRCPTPFTVGVLGKWGAGKTSIGSMLLSEINTDPSLQRRHKAMLFDVWKYPGDSLRRKFLLELASCLGETESIKNRQDLWDDLYTSRSEQKLRKRTFDAERGRSWWLVLAVHMIVGAGVIYWARMNQPSQQDYFTWVSILMGFVWAAIGALRSFTSETSSASTSTVAVPPLHSPEQFEERFETMLEDCGVSSREGDARLVVLVDNLDRCSSDDAVAALRTIKTFLEKDGCIFIIACDDAALKDHLKRVYMWGEEPDHQAEEYLRKFFNTTVTIRVAKEDHIELVESLTSRIGFPKAVAQVLWAGAPDNPRRVKQFLNRLRARDLVLQHEEQSGRLAPDVRQNLPFVAKMMVLEEQWRRFVDELQSDDTLLTRLGEVLMDPVLLEAETHADLSKYFSGDSNDDYYGLEEFLRATSGVKAKDHRPFLRLRQYSYEMAIDETSRLREDVRLGAFPRIASVIEASDRAQAVGIWRIICQVIDEERQARRGQTAIASANAATELFEACPEELRVQAAASITTTAGSVGSYLPDVLPRKVLGMLEYAEPVWARSVVARMVNSLADIGPYFQDLLSSLPEHHALLSDLQLRRIGSLLTERLGENAEAVLGLLQGLDAEEPGIQRLFTAGPELLGAVVGQVDPIKLEQASNAAEIYVTFKGSAPDTVRAQMIGAISALLAFPTDPPMGPQKELALSVVDQLDLPDIPLANTDALGASLLAATAQLGHPPNKIRLWGQALRVRGQLSEGQGQAMDSELRKSVLDWPLEQVRALTQLQPLRAGEEAPTAARGALASRILDPARPWEEKAGLLECYAGTLPSQGDGQLVDLLGSMLDSTEVQMVGLSAEAAPKHFNSLDRDQQLRLLEKLRERTRSMGLAHKHLTLTALTSLTKMSDGLALRNAIGDELLSVMRDGDVSSVQNATRLYGTYRTRLSKERRATNARELIHSLERRRAELGEPFRAILELVAEECNEVKVGQSSCTQFVHLLLSMSQADRPADQRLLGMTLLAKLDSLPASARPEVKEQLETIINDESSPGSLSDAATDAHVRFFSRGRRASSEAQSHGEDALGNERAEGSDGGFTIVSGEIGEFSETREGPWSVPALCDPVHEYWSSIEGARWVWIRARPTDAEAQAGQTVWHRFAVELPPGQGDFSAILRLMVDDLVNVFIDEELIGRFEGHREPKEVDLTSHLVQGANLVEMQVENAPGHAESTGTSNPTGVIYRLDVSWGEAARILSEVREDMDSP